MRENKLRRVWKSGGAAVNGWLAIPNSFSAETMAQQGWDSLTVDLQHGVVDYQAMVTMLQVDRERVPALLRHRLGREAVRDREPAVDGGAARVPESTKFVFSHGALGMKC